jgi:hypothetical protein
MCRLTGSPLYLILKRCSALMILTPEGGGLVVTLMNALLTRSVLWSVRTAGSQNTLWGPVSACFVWNGVMAAIWSDERTEVVT